MYNSSALKQSVNYNFKKLYIFIGLYSVTKLQHIIDFATIYQLTFHEQNITLVLIYSFFGIKETLHLFWV